MVLTIIGTVVVAVAMAINFNITYESTDANFEVQTGVIEALAFEVVLDINDEWCTCKNGVCQDGWIIQFRKWCHTFDTATDKKCYAYSSKCEN